MTNKELIPLSSNTLAQLAHVGWGAMLVFVLALLSGHIWISFAIVLAFVTAKEFIYDYVWEDAITRGSSLEDWVYWWFGILIALGTLLSAR